MVSTVQDLEKRTNDLVNSIDSLKTSPENSEKKEVQEQISADLNKLKTEIAKKLQLTGTSEQEKKKLQELKERLEKSSTTLETLKAEILQESTQSTSPTKEVQNSGETPKTASSSAETTNAPSKEKGFWENRVAEPWDKVWDKEKWKEEPGKNFLRTAGFAATIVG